MDGTRLKRRKKAPKMNVNKEALQIKKELPKTLIISSFIAIVFVLFLLPFIAWLLEYKDTISAPLTITTKTTPIDIYTKVPGELILLVKNNTFVEEGTPLAIIRNTTDHSKLKEIQQVLSQENLSNLDKVEALKKSENTELGELKPLLVAALKASEDYKTFLKTDQHQTLIQSLTDQIGLYESRALIFQKGQDL